MRGFCIKFPLGFSRVQVVSLTYISLKIFLSEIILSEGSSTEVTRSDLVALV